MQILRTLARAPLLHFLLIGAGIFLLFAWMNNDTTDTSNIRAMHVSLQEVEVLSQRFEKTWRRPPTVEELDALVDRQITDHILVVEAQALGLGERDVIVENRLRQKMIFLIESAAAAERPSDLELRDYYLDNQEIYRVAGLSAFEQVFLGPSADEAEMAALRERLNAGSVKNVNDSMSLLPPKVPLATGAKIDSIFGEGFATALEEAPLHNWTGPVLSSYGKHLVRVSERVTATLPALEDIRTQVTRDYLAETHKVAAKDVIAEIRKGYAISRPTKAEVSELLQ